MDQAGCGNIVNRPGHPAGITVKKVGIEGDTLKDKNGAIGLMS